MGMLITGIAKAVSVMAIFFDAEATSLLSVDDRRPNPAIPQEPAGRSSGGKKLPREMSDISDDAKAKKSRSTLDSLKTMTGK